MLVDSAGQPVGKINHEYPQIYPKPSWVEHNPVDIWGSVIKCISEVLNLTGVNPKDIAGIGITNQRETTLIWDRKSSQPVYNAIVWRA